MAEWPLRGRDAELAHLTELLEDPEARGVVLAGPQGVGKSRLGQECLRLARQRGMVAERVSATFAASTLPLGAVILARPPQNAVVSSRLEQTELVHRVATELVRQAGGRRLVLWVDDVHWLDQLSAVLIHQLVVTGAAFVVLTARTGLAVPDPLAALWKDELVERISLGPVAREAVEPLLAEVLGAPVAGAALAQLADRSEGNLLFLREQVLAALEDGSLALDSGVWQLAPAPAPQARLIELVELRLAGLGSEAAACLEVIAFAEPLELSDAAALSSEQLIQQLEHQGLVSVRSDGWGGAKVLLAHPLIGEVIRAQTSVIRARHITEVLAVAAEARTPTQPDEVLRIAAWRLVCGGGTPALMLEAATAAYARRDYEFAAQIAKGAVVAGAGIEAELLLAVATGFAGRRAQAERDLAALSAVATSPDQLAAIAHARLVNAHLAGDHVLGLRIYREALIVIEDSRWRAELTAKRAWHVTVQEGPRGALRATDELWAGPHAGSPFCAAATVRAAALARSGRMAEALDAVSQGRAAQERLTEPYDLHPLAAEIFACEALATAGRIEEWEHRAQQCYRAAIQDRSAAMQLYFAYQLAKANLARGRVATASRLAGEAVGIAHQIDEPAMLIAGLTTLAECLALRGDPDGAARTLGEMESVRQNPWLFAEPGIARAWIAVGRGDLISARRALEGEVERGMAWDDFRGASLALHSLVRLGGAGVACNRLEELALRVEGGLVPAQARHAAAVVARDGRALEQVAVEFLAMSATLLSAEAYCDAAVAWRATGDPKRAARTSQRASLLLDQCEGAVTPASQPLAVRTELTPAERATAMLAARGQSNRDIAAMEQVSVRTVESRLQCVYTKLGISSRRDLAEQLVNPTPPEP